MKDKKQTNVVYLGRELTENVRGLWGTVYMTAEIRWECMGKAVIEHSGTAFATRRRMDEVDVHEFYDRFLISRATAHRQRQRLR